MNETPKIKLYQKVNIYGGDSWIVNTIAKEDLERYLTKEEIKKLTDEDMSYIAEKLSDAISDTSYWDCLGAILSDWKEGRHQI